MKKRILAAIVCAATVLSLTGCGKEETSAPANTGSSTVNTGTSTPTTPTSTSKTESSTPQSTLGATEESKPEESSAPEIGTNESDFIVQETDGGVYIERYTGNDKNVEIPETIGGKSVVGIGKGAFSYNEDITGVTIPASVKWLTDKGDEEYDKIMIYYMSGEGAFFGCENLSDVTFLGNQAPDFYEGDFLETPWLDAKKTENSDYLALNNTLVRWWKNEGTAAVPEGITKIGCYAFKDKNNITSISIPDSVTEIGKHAFHYCGIESITIPNSVTELGAGAFDNCQRLLDVTLSENITCIREFTFAGCNTIDNLILPDGLTTVEANAFHLTSVSFTTYKGKKYLGLSDFINDTQDTINWE